MGNRELRERRPQGAMWSRGPTPPLPAEAISSWRRRSISVISSLEIADYPRGGGSGPQWHVSVCGVDNLAQGRPSTRRPTEQEVRVARYAFGMATAEEDNHHPGKARHFWLPVDPARRVTCECKDDEVTVVEPDGYTWTNPHDPAECRGCELAAELGTPCPIHEAPRG